MNINSHLKVMALLINGAFNFHGKFIPNALSTVIKTNSTAATKKSKMPVHRRAGGGGGGRGIPLEQPLALYDSFLVAVVKLVLIMFFYCYVNHFAIVLCYINPRWLPSIKPFAEIRYYR